MTLFTPQAIEKTLDIKKYLTFTKKDRNTYKPNSDNDTIIFKINKNDLPHEDFIIIKNLILTLKLKTNDYGYSKSIYEKYFLNQQYRLTYKFKIDEDVYGIEQQISKQFDNFNIITNAVNSLNPLYNAIEDLPSLNIKILDNYSFENGFIDNIQIDISTVKDINQRLWSHTWYDFTNIFKYELKIEYATTRF